MNQDSFRPRSPSPGPQSSSYDRQGSERQSRRPAGNYKRRENTDRSLSRESRDRRSFEYERQNNGANRGQSPYRRPDYGRPSGSMASRSPSRNGGAPWSYSTSPRVPSYPSQPTGFNGNMVLCTNCNRTHINDFRSCFAYNLDCHFCGARGHIATCCQRRNGTPSFYRR